MLGAGQVPIRADRAEEVLKGSEATDELLSSAAAAVPESLSPSDDVHASSDYRRHVAGVLARRVLTQARKRASR